MIIYLARRLIKMDATILISVSADLVDLLVVGTNKAVKQLVELHYQSKQEMLLLGETRTIEPTLFNTGNPLSGHSIIYYKDDFS